MKVFKFGGASVNSAEAIRNVARIVQRHKNESLVVVVSAMGKMTNYFELLNSYYIEKSDQLSSQLKSIRKFHEEVLDQLIESEDNRAHKILDHIFVDLQLFLDTNSSESYDLIYDRIVGYGEMLSTTIIYSFLEQEGLNVKWIDAKDLIKTDEHHREANVLWDETKEKIKEQLRMDDSGHPIYITQGFISATMEGVATTLGREGSDYTDSIFANILDA